MPGGRGSMEVGRRLPLHHRDFHNCLLAAWACEVLKSGLGRDWLFTIGKFFNRIIPKSIGFRVGL
jgi:hypothetical protein